MGSRRQEPVFPGLRGRPCRNFSLHIFRRHLPVNSRPLRRFSQPPRRPIWLLQLLQQLTHTPTARCTTSKRPRSITLFLLHHRYFHPLRNTLRVGIFVRLMVHKVLKAYLHPSYGERRESKKFNFLSKPITRCCIHIKERIFLTRRKGERVW